MGNYLIFLNLSFFIKTGEENLFQRVIKSVNLDNLLKLLHKAWYYRLTVAATRHLAVSSALCLVILLLFKVTQLVTGNSQINALTLNLVLWVFC